MSKNVCHIFQQRKNIYIILDILQRISENSNVTRAEKNTQHCQLKLCQMKKKEKERKSNPSTCREEIWSQNSQPDKKKKRIKASLKHRKIILSQIVHIKEKSPFESSK